MARARAWEIPRGWIAAAALSAVKPREKIADVCKAGVIAAEVNSIAATGEVTVTIEGGKVSINTR